MTPTRKLSRRSFLSQIAGGAVLVAAAVVIPTEEAEAQITDRDSGRYADPVGRGRGRRRRRRGRTGITDRDPGDPAGNGRGYINRNRNCTDSDPGDPAGRSRFCRRR